MGYGVTDVFRDAFFWSQVQLEFLIRSWGVAGLTFLLGFAVLWKLFLRVR